MGILLVYYPAAQWVMDKELYSCSFLDFSFAMAALCRARSYCKI